MERPTARPVGRPRSADAHQAILTAALDLFIALGYEGMSIEGVAAQSGVAKTTVYRRWPSKAELIVEALEAVFAELTPPPPDTGSVRHDLIELLVSMQRLMASSPLGQVFPRIAPEVVAGTPLGQAYLERVIRPQQATVEAILTRGVRRGELGSGFDVELARDMVAGPVVLAKLTRQPPARSMRVRAQRIVDILLGGLGVGTPHHAGRSDQ